MSCGWVTSSSFFNNKILDTIKVYNILKLVYYFTHEPHYNMQFKIILILIEIKKCYEYLLCPSTTF